MYRKSIYETGIRFKAVLEKIDELLAAGKSCPEIADNLKTEYQEAEIVSLLENLRSLGHFKKVDKITVVYRILAILYFILLIANFYVMTFLFNLQKELESVDTKIDFADPAFGSLIGALLFVFVIINAFKETAMGDVFAIVAVAIFSSFAFDIFILFKKSSIYFWIPIVIYIAIVIISWRPIKGKRIKLLELSKKVDKTGFNLEPIFSRL